MLIDDYEIELNCPQCHPGAESWVATVATSADLSELMPYVNARVPRGEFVPSVPTLVWRRDAHKVFLRPRQFGISNLSDRAQAEREVKELVAFLNETWTLRASITPQLSSRPQPTLFDILKLLPRSNCGQCGLASCMAYAALLGRGEKGLGDCPVLQQETWAVSREALVALGL